MSERIRRTVEFQFDPEVRQSGNKLRLRGHAAVFNSESRDMGFVEVLRPGAFKRALANPNTDVVLNFNHDNSLLLARQSAGNLRLAEDERGLAIDAELPDTSLARDVVELVRSRTLRSMSFMFDLDESAGASVRKGRRDGKPFHEIASVGNLYDVSVVTEPAYSAPEVVARSAAALEAIRRHARPRDDGPYGPDKPFSYFRDIATVSEASAGANEAKISGQRFEGRFLERGAGHPVHGRLDDALGRLKDIEGRAISAPNWSFVPTDGGPGFVGELFAAAVRTKAVLASRLPNHELPKDLNIKVPRLSSGAIVGYQLENQPTANADPTTALNTSPVATIAGYVDASRQDLDQSPGNLVDQAIAADLGGAFAAMLEQEVINGDGGGDGEHLLGILNTAGTTLTTYTDATPTPAEFLSQAVGAGYAATSTAYGAPIDAIVLHSRRRAWVEQKLGSYFQWPAEVIESMGIPTNLGAGTEDAVILLSLEETYLLTGEIRFDVLTEINSSTLGVRFRVYGYCALLAGRQPASIGVVAGSGLAEPVW